MGFNTTKWEYSDVEEQAIEYAKPVEGDRWLKIISADFDPNEETYRLHVQDLGNNARFDLRYWLNSKTDDGSVKANTSHRNALVQLGKAIFGPTFKGLPHPDDLNGFGRVAMGTIKLKASGEKQFPRCFHFEAVPDDIACLADSDQYYIGYVENSE